MRGMPTHAGQKDGEIMATSNYCDICLNEIENIDDVGLIALQPGPYNDDRKDYDTCPECLNKVKAYVEQIRCN